MSQDDTTILLRTLIEKVSRLEAVLTPKPKRHGYTVAGAARVLGVSRWTIQDRIRKNKLTKVNGRIPANQIDPELS
jgi:hypothetical protein